MHIKREGIEEKRDKDRVVLESENYTSFGTKLNPKTILILGRREYLDVSGFRKLQHQETEVLYAKDLKTTMVQRKEVSGGVFETPKDYSLIVQRFIKPQSLLHPNTHYLLKMEKVHF